MRISAVFLLAFISVLFGTQIAAAQYQMCFYPGYGYAPCQRYYQAPTYNQPMAPQSPNPSADYNPYGGRSGYGVEASGGYYGGRNYGGGECASANGRCLH